ncbi:MAG: helix-turn-helix domain-containing protein [Desulfomonilaceae bacterium]|nr:helix-turn-helix domain-containing protein [Desulfomonilaceae bacterium]
MYKRQRGSDAFEMMYRRYIKDDPARVASFQEEMTKAEIAREIYGLREQAGLTQEQLAELVGTDASVIDDIEEADYGGDFLAMASKIATALQTRVEVHLIPIERNESVGATA